MTTISKKESLPTKNISKKTTTANKGNSEKTSKIDASQRHNMISEAAYYIAEKNGFEGSSMHDDWLSAEQEIDEKWSTS